MDTMLVDKIMINHAEIETLQQLPGVGPKLAEQIHDARPFNTLEEMTRVNGVGPNMIEAWRTLADFSMTPPGEIPEAPTDEKVSDPPFELTTSEDSDVSVLEPIDLLEPDPAIETSFEEPIPPLLEINEKEPEEHSPTTSLPEPLVEDIPERVEQTPPREKNTDKYLTRKQAFWTLVFGMLFTFILATAISLGLLAVVNHGELQFASPAEVSTLNAEVASINDRINTQEESITTLNERIDNLEALSDRMTAAETEIESLHGETDLLSTEIDAVEENVSTLQTEVVNLQSQTETFTTFFESMRDLFMQFFPFPGQD